MPFRFEHLRLFSTSGPIWVLYLTLLASSLSFAMGIRPKLSGTVATLLNVLFVARNPGATWGWGMMIQPFMFYTIFAASDKQWSVRGWWRTYRGKPRDPTQWTCPAWPQRLFQIHVTCVFLVLWSRFDEQSWLAGQALPFVLTNRDWGRFDFDFSPYFGVLEVASVAALALECAAPIALWIRPIGKFWALALIGLFATLVVTSSVGWWDFMMMFVLAVFLPTEWLARFLAFADAPTRPAESSSDVTCDGPTD